MKTINQLFSICVFALSSTLVLAQVDNVDLKAFDKLDIATNVEVEVLEGAPRAEINMVRGDREDLLVQVNGDELLIKFKNKKWGLFNGGNPKAKIKVYTNRPLKYIEASSSSLVYSDLVFKVDKFEADASSSATIEVAVDADKVTAEASSSSEIVIDGTTDDLSIAASSSADIKAKNLKANYVKAKTSSSASVTVWANEKLTAKASSSSSIKYKGDPANKDVSSNSSGSVKKM